MRSRESWNVFAAVGGFLQHTLSIVAKSVRLRKLETFIRVKNVFEAGHGHLERALQSRESPGAHFSKRERERERERESRFGGERERETRCDEVCDSQRERERESRRRTRRLVSGADRSGLRSGSRTTSSLTRSSLRPFSMERRPSRQRRRLADSLALSHDL